MHSKKNKKRHTSPNILMPVILTFLFAFVISFAVYAVQVKVVTINNKGKVTTVRTMGTLVKDVLKESNIDLEKGDIVNPDLSSAIQTRKTISISRNAFDFLIDQNCPTEIAKDKEDCTLNVKTVTHEYKVPYKVIRKPNYNKRYGVTKVIRQGVAGIQLKTFKVTYKNGEKYRSRLVTKKVVVKPIAKVVEYGAMRTILTSRGDVLRYRRALDMRATAYDSSYESCGKRPGSPGYGITASGLHVRPGIVAVDPRVIPLGTRLYVESTQNGVKSYGIALAADTGGAIKGNKIDLYFETRREVDNFGVRKVKVYVLE